MIGNFGPFLFSFLGHCFAILYLSYQTSVSAMALVDYNSPFALEIQSVKAQAQPQKIRSVKPSRKNQPQKQLSQMAIQNKQTQEKTLETSVEEFHKQIVLNTGGQQGLASATDSGAGTTTYVEGLRSWIESHKKFPRKAQRLNMSGQVVVLLQVDRSGFFKNLALAQSSNHVILDEAALSLLKKIGSYRPFPDYLKDTKLTVRLPINYISQ